MSKPERQGRGTASPATTTRRAELGAFPVFKGEEPVARFSETDLAVLAPSIPAIELAEYLEKPDGFFADHRAASRPPTKHELTDDERAEVAALRKSRDHSPAKREDLIKAIWSRSRAERNRLHRECLAHAKRWITLVRLYEIDRPYLLTLPEAIRIKLCRKLAADVRRASSNDIPAANRAEARRRGVNKRALGKDIKRRRKAFRWRGRTDGVGGEGYAGGARRLPATPMTPDGQVDAVALARSEMLLAHSTWRATGTNGGVGVFEPEPWEPGGQCDTTEELRIAKRITDEVNNFRKKKKDRSA
jgi:hypothetical protein